jgi:3-deoxy-D-arabino-heptulosonate 7-phosphate (DAHP) synthase class II
MWSPNSWRAFPSVQQPVYPDRAALDRALAEIAALPPLVTSYEIGSLKSQLAEAARGERFILWGGDCAESFADCTSPAIAAKLKILLQMSLVLVNAPAHHPHRPVRRSVREAAERAHGSPRRRRAPELPRRQHQPPGVHARGAHARPAAAPARIRAQRAHAQLHPRAR